MVSDAQVAVLLNDLRTWDDQVRQAIENKSPLKHELGEAITAGAQQLIGRVVMVSQPHATKLEQTVKRFTERLHQRVFTLPEGSRRHVLAPSVPTDDPLTNLRQRAIDVRSQIAVTLIALEMLTPPTVTGIHTSTVPPLDAKAVYISYAWGNEGEGIVDRVYDSLKADDYDVRRDKQHLSYTGSITEFMKEFGHAACIVVIVSDKSLRSLYCMFELLEIHRNHQFRERICPIVMSDAKIHSPADRLEYVAHWKAEYRQLEKLVKNVGIDVLSADGSFREYEKFRDISQHADKLLTILGDMNTSTPSRIEANDFELLKQAITERIDQPSVNA